jgi:hypothetical protein
MLCSCIRLTIFVALSMSTAYADKGRRLKGPKAEGVFAAENVTVSSLVGPFVTDNGYGGFTNITNFNFTELQNRGDPVDYPPYQSEETVTEDSGVEVLASGDSGSGYGSCVCCKSQGFPSELDMRGRKGVFKAKYNKGLTCSFVNDYFSGYVCPCKSVCGHYTDRIDFLKDYCKRFLKWPGDDGSYEACTNYVWNCCGYPYYCGRE